MRSRALLAASLLFLACADPSAGGQSDVVQTLAWVVFSDAEGGHWVLDADNGRTYSPRPALPPGLQVDGARVEVSLVERPDLFTLAPGMVADILHVAPFGCDGVRCGPQPPPVSVTVTSAATSLPVPGVTIENLVGPPPAAPYGPASASCGSTGLLSVCFIHGGLGAYAFDVAAPGYQAVHVELAVPAWTPIPGLCCQADWQAQDLAVALTPL